MDFDQILTIFRPAWMHPNVSDKITKWTFLHNFTKRPDAPCIFAILYNSKLSSTVKNFLSGLRLFRRDCFCRDSKSKIAKNIQILSPKCKSSLIKVVPLAQKAQLVTYHHRALFSHSMIRHKCPMPGCKNTYADPQGLRRHVEATHEGMFFGLDLKV